MSKPLRELRWQIRVKNPKNGWLLNGNYFFLNGNCFLVNGALNAAAYCLSSGDVYAIDCYGRQLIESCENGMPVEYVLSHASRATGEDEALKYLHNLEMLGLGAFRNEPVPPPKMELPSRRQTVRKIWLEVKRGCNLNCVHCYADCSSGSAGESLSQERWLAIVSEAAGLGARWIQLIGGEPLLYRKRDLFELISRAKREQFDFIEVFTNGTLLDEEHIKFFAEHGVHIALSIYSRRPEIHDSVTGKTGSFQKTMSSAQRLKEQGVPLRFGLVVMGQNCEYEAETLDWLTAEYRGVPINSDIVRSTEGSRDTQMKLLTPDLLRRRLRTQPAFPKVIVESFIRNKSGNSCFDGQICVQANGEVYPCIMERTQALGNVVGSSLKKIVEGERTREIWGLSRDKIPVCCDCEFRYACFDCRPLSRAMSESVGQNGRDMRTKDPCCLYNPYTGNWGNAEEYLEKLAAKGQ
ncbi:MAG: radical SAM protein [Chloroflexi bacterium]|nr:radical SAM protein [Chloroflexota bacterium]